MGVCCDNVLSACTWEPIILCLATKLLYRLSSWALTNTLQKFMRRIPVLQDEWLAGVAGAADGRNTTKRRSRARSSQEPPSKSTRVASTAKASLVSLPSLYAGVGLLIIQPSIKDDATRSALIDVCCRVVGARRKQGNTAWGERLAWRASFWENPLGPRSCRRYDAQISCWQSPAF